MNDASAREKVRYEELEKLRSAGVVFLDSRRTRPNWFDGRFLKAQDLNQEQNYFLVRQSDLAVAVGTGVIEGLFVEAVSDSPRIIIHRGHGVTGGGERVVLERDLTLDPSAVPVLQALNGALMLSNEPAPALRNRTGVFLVLLRALEFTANPIASYPTRMDGERSVHEGEIIEATAVSLVPYHLSSVNADHFLRRAEAAYRIFAGGGWAAPQNTLPLAMVELDRGGVVWVDNFLVRREMGSSHRDLLGFGSAPQPVREAFLQQYLQMLEEVVHARTRSNTGLRFAASEHFLTLPAAGRLPSDAVDAKNRIQYFFPPAMDVEISFVPEDEIPLLVQESMVLPPLDLTASEEVQESTSVLVLVPVQRSQLASALASLPLERVDLAPPVLRPPSRLKPVERLDTIRMRLPSYTKPLPAVQLSDERLVSLARSRPFLWYVRRRNLSYKASVAGEGVRVTPENEFGIEGDLLRRVQLLKVDKHLAELKEKASAAAHLAAVRVLASERFDRSHTLTLAALQEMKNLDQVNERSVYGVAEKYNVAETGAGLERLEAEVREMGEDDATVTRNAKRLGTLANFQRVLELDRVARGLSTDQMKIFGAKVKEAAELSADDAAKRLDALIAEQEG